MKKAVLLVLTLVVLIIMLYFTNTITTLLIAAGIGFVIGSGVCSADNFDPETTLMQII
jgi:hypothetical protein